MRKFDELVSIMIPVYNREKIISETLECAINQTYKNIEILVSDNCSTDNTWSILEEYALKDNRIKIFKNKVNLGPVLNWKNCIEKVSGSYTKILWSDDLISNDFIEKCLKLFDNDTAFVMTGVRIFNSEDNSTISISKYQNKQVYSKQEYLNDFLLFNSKGFPVSPGCALFRTEDIKNAFFEEIDNSENLDFKKFGAGNDSLFFLITANKYKFIKTTNEISSFFRSHPTSLSISNKLNLYYEYANAFFINNYYQNFKKEYKSKLFLIKHFKSEFKISYNTFQAKINLKDLTIIFFVYCYIKIKFVMRFLYNKV